MIHVVLHNYRYLINDRWTHEKKKLNKYLLICRFIYGIKAKEAHNVRIFRFHGPLHFANVEKFRDKLNESTEFDPIACYKKKYSIDGTRATVRQSVFEMRNRFQNTFRRLWPGRSGVGGGAGGARQRADRASNYIMDDYEEEDGTYPIDTQVSK